MPDLDSRLLAHVRETGLFPRPGLALLAVSGGEDSVALLDLFSALAADLGLGLALAHVDHGITPGSEDVAEQVLALAVRYEVRGHLVSLALGPDASETGARRERYRALREIQQRLVADYLVTAHHADDQMETVLYRLLRGSAPAGLAGIPARGPQGLVRPLLPFRRTELHEWLLTRHPSPETRPPFFSDPANRNPKHDRSWLRERMLPLLRERFPRVDQGLLAAPGYAARDRAAWKALLRQLPELEFRVTTAGVEVARHPLRAYDQTLSEALLRALAREAGCLLGPARVARLRRFVERSKSGQVFQLSQGWVAEVAFDRLRMQRASRAQAAGAAGWGGEASGAVRWGAWEVIWRREPAGPSVRNGPTVWIGPGAGEIRGVRPGDRIYPLGGIGHRPVRRVLMEARVSRSERLAYPVLVRGEEILWVPGVCRSATDVPKPGAAALRIDGRRR